LFSFFLFFLFSFSFLGGYLGRFKYLLVFWFLRGGRIKKRRFFLDILPLPSNELPRRASGGFFCFVFGNVYSTLGYLLYFLILPWVLSGVFLGFCLRSGVCRIGGGFITLSGIQKVDAAGPGEVHHVYISIHPSIPALQLPGGMKGARLVVTYVMFALYSQT